MTVLGAFAVPHPPIIVPGVGGGEEKLASATVDAFHKVGKTVAKLAPELIIIITPHGELFRDAFYISTGGERITNADGASKVWGDFADFRDAKDRLELALDEDFVETLIKCVEDDERSLPYVASPMPDDKLDHGCMVPLYFISQYLNMDVSGWSAGALGAQPKIVRIGISFLGDEAHRHLGRCIASTIESLDRRAVIIASGDLSHKLEGSHYGHDPAGAQFDRKITEVFDSGKLEQLLTIDAALREDAAECGLNSFIVMLGALENYKYESRLLSYEGPWGIGYGVAEFSINGEVTMKLSLPVRMAFGVLDDLLAGHLPPYENSPAVAALIASLNAEDMQFYEELRSRQAGCFVSFHKGPDLRGCIGTISATCDNLTQEIYQNTVSAATRDPRFPVIRQDEVPELDCSVDVLGDAEPVNDRSALDAKRYGVIVSAGYRRGVLLPDLDGVNTPEQQIAIALQKAGISPHQNYDLERFEVIRYE